MFWEFVAMKAYVVLGQCLSNYKTMIIRQGIKVVAEWQKFNVLNVSWCIYSYTVSTQQLASQLADYWH